MQPIRATVGVRSVKVDKGARVEFEEWLVAREPSLHRLAHMLADQPHDADDLVQKTLAKMYLAWDRLHERHNIDTYARRVLINEHRTTWSRTQRRLEVITDKPPELAPAGAQSQGKNSEVWAFVASLPPRQRAVIVLRYYEGLTESEIADVLGVAVGTVKSQASRAIAGLRSRFPQESR